MGFVSGFTGGVTVTLAIAYYAAISHENNRLAQAVNLRHATRTLNSVFEPPSEPLGPTRAELLRAERSSILENAKDKWNSEIERGVRWLQNADWEDIKERRDEAIARVLGGGLESTRHGIESAEAKTSQITKEVTPKTEQLRMEAKTTSAGTVDAVRGAVRDAVSKGIEKGKQLAGKAQDAVGAAVDTKVDEKAEVERALAERYMPHKTTPDALEKSPEQALAERYKSTA